MKRQVRSGGHNPENLGLLIAAARRSIKRAVWGCVSVHRLTPQQFWTLAAVHREPGLGQGELAHRRRMDAPTASRVISALVKRKLVRVEADERDRRIERIHLTDNGMALAPRLSQVANEIQRNINTDLDARAVATTVQTLQQIIVNMDQFEAAPKATRSRNHRARGSGSRAR